MFPAFWQRRVEVTGVGGDWFCLAVCPGVCPNRQDSGNFLSWGMCELMLCLPNIETACCLASWRAASEAAFPPIFSQLHLRFESVQKMAPSRCVDLHEDLLMFMEWGRVPRGTLPHSIGLAAYT